MAAAYPGTKVNEASGRARGRLTKYGYNTYGLGSLNPFAHDYCGFSAFEEAKEFEIRAKMWELARFPGFPATVVFVAVGILGMTWEAPHATAGTFHDGDAITLFPRMDVVLALIAMAGMVVATFLSVYSLNFAPLSSWRSWWYLAHASFKLVFLCFSLFWVRADETARLRASSIISIGNFLWLPLISEAIWTYLIFEQYPFQ